MIVHFDVDSLQFVNSLTVSLEYLSIVSAGHELPIGNKSYDEMKLIKLVKTF